MTYVGRYKLIKTLSRGVASELFLAEAASIEGFRRQVVVKCLSDDFAADVEARRMFIDEARLCGKLPHANLPFVFDFGRDGERLFMVMEHVEGETLATILEASAAQRLPKAAVLVVITGLLRALQAIHDLRDDVDRPLAVVHRDVSPDNVLVSLHGEVKLVDFGIAKHAERLSVTRQGIVRGKYRYLAPEVANGEPATPQSDQYSAALVFYEMLHGGPAFVGDEGECLLQAQRGALPLPLQGAGSFAAPLERALQMSAAERFPSCLAVCKHYEAIAIGEGLVADPELLASQVRKCSLLQK